MYDNIKNYTDFAMRLLDRTVDTKRVQKMPQNRFVESTRMHKVHSILENFKLKVVFLSLDFQGMPILLSKVKHPCETTIYVMKANSRQLL